MRTAPEISVDALTGRQRDVLDAALGLIVGSQEPLTMAAVAQRASCSKETLYKWFGDRDGLLTATVQWQASQVRIAPVDRAELDARRLAESLRQFATDWLRVITGQTSVALNRVAIGQSRTDRLDLGAIVLRNGPIAMAQRLMPVLEMGREAGLLRFNDADEAFRTFFGLVVRDVQIRLLLGDRLEAGPAAIERDARRATEQFFALYGQSTIQPEAAGNMNATRS